MQEPTVRHDLSGAIAAYVVAGAAGLATHIAIARQLGRHAFGTYVAALALVYLLRGLTRFGGVSLVVREGARDRSSLDISVPVLARVTAVGALALIAVATLAAAALGYGATGVLIVAILGLSVGADCVADAYRGALQATGHMRASSMISASTTGMSALASVSVIAAGNGVVAAASASMLISVIAAPIAAVIARRTAGLHPADTRGHARPFLRRVRPFAYTSALSMGANTVDGVLVRTMLGTSASGAYGGPYRIFSAIGWGAHAYAAVLLPRLARLQAAAGDRTFARAVRHAAATAGAVMVPVAFLGALLAEPVILVAFGEAYRDAIAPMRILFLALPATYASVVMRQALLAGGRAPAAAKIAGFALAFNAASNIALLPTVGISGAAVLTIATDTAVAALCVAALRPARDPGGHVPVQPAAI